MEKAKSIGEALSKALLPHEFNILKFEDLLLFVKPKRSAAFFVGLNLLLIGFFCLGLSFYATFFLALGLYSLRGMWFPTIANFFTKFVLDIGVYDFPQDSQIRRYSVAEISAFVGTAYYILHEQYEKAMKAVAEQEVFNMSVVMFVLMFVFYLFLSFNDAIITILLINAILLIPYVSQTNILEKITAKITALAQKATTLKPAACEKEEEGEKRVKQD